MRFVLIFFALSLVTQSEAAPRRIAGDLLQLVVTNIVDYHNQPVGSRPATVITLLATGEVEGAKCTEKKDAAFPERRALYVDCHSQMRLDSLSRREQRRIEKLIAATRNVPLKAYQMACEAMPLRNETFYANYEQTLLLDGQFPCGAGTERDSREAKELVEFLRGNFKKYRP